MLAGVYGVVAFVTLIFARQSADVAVVWPASAISIGLPLLWRRTDVRWDAAAVGAANLLVNTFIGTPPLVAVALAAASATSLLVAFALFRLAGLSHATESRLRSVLTLLFVSVATPVMGAVIGGVALSLHGLTDPVPLILSWWLAEAVSNMILLPVFFYWPTEAHRARLAMRVDQRERERRKNELALASLALLCVSLLPPLLNKGGLIQLASVAMLYVALRFGMFVTAVTVAIYASLVVLAATVGFWPLSVQNELSILALQTQLVLTTLPALVVAAVTSQGEHTRRALDATARRLEFALEGANDGLWDWHFPSQTAFYSGRYREILGYSRDTHESFLAWSHLIHPEDRERTEKAFAEHVSGATPTYHAEMRARTGDGSWIWVLDRGKVVERDADGEAVRAVGTLTDISGRKTLEEALEHLATHDPLTGLLNRGVFERGLVRAGLRLDRHGGRVAVLLVDLDHFKSVNDTYGHAAGDLLLEATGERLRRVVRDDDLAARLGGDEFAIIASGHSASEFDGLAQRLCDELSAPVSGAGFEVRPSVSIGVAVATTGSQVGEDLVARADRALYAAKSAGRGTWRFFGGRQSSANG
ncbi:diguanylate cyclase domain-containing protein [Methylopila musalis]|uniref:Diguanylate cyclase domain-containing protein n=1 Tax=Methylopila musalis TaxID=1134781 RepID=A0ABW3Z459_9HYPH